MTETGKRERGEERKKVREGECHMTGLTGTVFSAIRILQTRRVVARPDAVATQCGVSIGDGVAVTGETDALGPGLEAVTAAWVADGFGEGSVARGTREALECHKSLGVGVAVDGLGESGCANAGEGEVHGSEGGGVPEPVAVEIGIFVWG